MPTPTTMRAIEITAPGGPEVLSLTTRTTPTPAAHQVLIKVAAAGVNRPDVMQRKGLYPAPPGASDIPGLEISGTVIALGEQIEDLNIGDHVCALVTGGGYAEYCLASADCCLPIPAGLSLVQTAALPETFFTVWSNVFDRARLQASETLLIHGGSSGIGTTAIQLAKAFNAKVFVTAGNSDKCQRCLQLGADATINYHAEDFVDAILNLTQNKGVDVILDMVGGDYLPRNIKCMADDARLVQIAVQHGPKTDINLLPIMLKRLTITGSTLRARDNAFKADIAKQLLNNVWPLLATGKIKPIIHSTFSLSDAAKAHKLMESSQHFGKIILEVNPT
ncbi:MAG: NAD(P)H-quinone oxidoreductase [Methylococcaceae bacterium]|nr:NAD(P)H-quinone oxidoreductase [Methylococcaceae bacterium]MDP2394102.1 NAD(P)H-quinone oxidoreductase [Methylococcaceae bacterium]MDP3019692.1 NAD(P)H-quinone oxidoreductase [Methylococcaceae bacterium]MDP3389970.1 NAD(P)H-quinone oxidoreductase [Methylococcaceae bacterium]MDP3933635.1 NAD(P)H-quinone oxidoreductase [Methylococcaceae bacterium]